MEYLLYFWKKMLYSIKILTTSIQNFTLLPFSYFKRTPSFTSCADIINILIFPIQNDSLTKTEKTTNMNGRIFPFFHRSEERRVGKENMFLLSLWVGRVMMV